MDDQVVKHMTLKYLYISMWLWSADGQMVKLFPPRQWGHRERRFRRRTAL